MDKKFAAFEATQLQLQENQYQLRDTMNVLVQNSDTSTLGGGGIPPVIVTKSTVGGSVAEYLAMIAHIRELIAALADLKANPAVIATAKTGGREVIKHWRQWVE